MEAMKTALKCFVLL